MQTESIQDRKIRRLVSLKLVRCRASELLPQNYSSFYSGKSRNRYPFATNLGPDFKNSRLVWIDIDMLREWKILKDGTVVNAQVFKSLEELAKPAVDMQKSIIYSVTH